jgi:hypothetical protein
MLNRIGVSGTCRVTSPDQPLETITIKMLERLQIAVIDNDQSVRESVVGLVESVGYDALFLIPPRNF